MLNTYKTLCAVCNVFTLNHTHLGKLHRIFISTIIECDILLLTGDLVTLYYSLYVACTFYKRRGGTVSHQFSTAAGMGSPHEISRTFCWCSLQRVCVLCGKCIASEGPNTSWKIAYTARNYWLEIRNQVLKSSKTL